MANYKFIKDYTYKTGSTCPEGMFGCMPEIIAFKKGDILGGLTNNLSKDGKTVTSFRGNFSYIIPIEYVTMVKTNATNQPVEIPQSKTPTQQEPVSDLEYYTSANFLKRASVSIIPVGLIGAYCYHKKFSLLKSGLLISIPIVAITGLQYVFMGGGKNSYWGIFTPPSIRANQLKKIQLIEQQTGVPQKIK
jgi:hypothetical protein